jgi:cytochrome c oxidase subunit IV
MTHTITRRTYLTVWLILMALLVLTAAVDFVDLGPFNTVVAIGVAFVKAVLIVLYFMHVRASSRLTWLVAAAGFIWLAIMFTFIAGDYLTRGWLPVSGR